MYNSINGTITIDVTIKAAVHSPWSYPNKRPGIKQIPIQNKAHTPAIKIRPPNVWDESGASSTFVRPRKGGASTTFSNVSTYQVETVCFRCTRSFLVLIQQEMRL